MKKKGEGKPIDWDSIKQRLLLTQELLEKDFAPSSQACEQILIERARLLAREPERQSEESAKIEVLEFLVSNEHYAFETVHVHEVYALKELTALPCTPNFVLGIANIRGRIISIIDIRRFFDLPEKGISDLNKVIVLRNDSMEFGVLADEVAGVRWLSPRKIQGNLPTLTGIRAEHLKGVTAERLILLDAAKLLNDQSIVVNQEVLA